MDYGDLELLGLDFDEDEELELLGDDDDMEDEEDMGFRLMIPSRKVRGRTRIARTPAGRRVRVRASPRATKLRSIRRALVPRTPGAPRPGAREWALGFPPVSFTAVSGTTLRTQSEPQRAFKGSRLVVDVARTGPTATGLITAFPIFIGQVNQLVSAQPVSVGAFAPGAFHTTMSLDPATPGIDISIDYSTTVAPTAPDQIDVGTTLIGLSLGG